MFYLKHMSIALILLSIVACSGTAPRDLKPWEKPSSTSTSRDSSNSPAASRPNYGPKLAEGKPYTVKRGDTLYAIAFRLGIDFRELATRNAIKPPYRINVGQVLQTAKPAAVVSTESAKTSGSRKSTNTGARSPKTKVAASESKTTVQTQVQSPNRQTKVSRKAQPSKQAAPSKPAETNRPVSRWRWPSNGKVVRTFASNVHKGIDIAGSRGDPVTATAAGKVVYAGAGVTGYGSLIIVKHNDTYLSAYGHNEQLLVSEGSVVKVGQQIATMGSSGTNSVKLHFELRRQGKPVDPLTLLPKR